MGETTVLPRHAGPGTYELTDVLQGAGPGLLVLVGEHSTTGEMIADSATIRRCDAWMLN